MKINQNLRKYISNVGSDESSAIQKTRMWQHLKSAKVLQFRNEHNVASDYN